MTFLHRICCDVGRGGWVGWLGWVVGQVGHDDRGRSGGVGHQKEVGPHPSSMWWG